MVERQKDGKFRAHLNSDERLEVRDIDKLEQAVDIDRAINEAYRRGQSNPLVRWHDDYDD